MSSTQNLLDEHLIVRRLASIAKKCSDGLYSNQNIPIEDIQIISVVIEEFVEHFIMARKKMHTFPLQRLRIVFQKIYENSSLSMSLEGE